MEEPIQPGNEQEKFPFSFRKQPVPDAMRRKNWETIEAAITSSETLPARSRSWVRPLLMAAMLIVVITSGLWLLFDKTTPPPAIAALKTHYGEIKRITLPDSSLVILNANSSIRIPQDWSDKGDRQVWLEGEAYFEVSKKPATGQKFVVHTSRVDVEVLGTKFNVNTRREKSIVSLEEGKVQLKMRNQTAVREKKVLQLKPGETAIVDAAQGTIVNEEKEVIYHSGWSRNEFHFDNTPLTEVANLIEDVYGYKLQLQDTVLLQRSISGDLRAANINEFIKILEVTLKLKLTIDTKNKTIQVKHA